MKNVTAKFNFTLEDEAGNVLHTTDLEYKGLSEERVLFLEKHLIGALSVMNGEAAVAHANQGKGKQ